MSGLARIMVVLFVWSCRERSAPLPIQSAAAPRPVPSPASSAEPAAPPLAESTDAPLPSGTSVAMGDAILLEKVQLRDSRPAKQASPGKEELTCAIDAEYPKVRGLGPALSARIDEQLKPKEAVLEASCEMATTYEVRYRVALNDGELLSVVFDGNWCCGAHPVYSKRFVNVRVRDGQALTLTSSFRAGASSELSARLLPLVRSALADDPDASVEWMADLLGNPPDFSLEPSGVRFSLFNRAAHAFQAPFEPGFLLSCRSLKRLLRGSGSLEAWCARR
jgi:hypothetical protein